MEYEVQLEKLKADKKKLEDKKAEYIQRFDTEIDKVQKSINVIENYRKQITELSAKQHKLLSEVSRVTSGKVDVQAPVNKVPEKSEVKPSAIPPKPVEPQKPVVAANAPVNPIQSAKQTPAPEPLKTMANTVANKEQIKPAVTPTAVNRQQLIQNKLGLNNTVKI